MQEPTPPPVPPLAQHLQDSLEDPLLEDLRHRLQQQLPEYRLLSCLGRGGMGAVFQAYHARLDRRVAIKVLLPSAAPIAGWDERFLREARALARLTHPGIVTVHDFGQAEGLSWIVMEQVQGASLRVLLEEGRLPAAEALSIVPQVCAALQYAHDQGVVHRDVKPENILLDESGRVHIVDFGLAKLLGDKPGTRLSYTGQAMGTLRYMAPEQLDRPDKVDHRADIFSLGVVFYEMLTGQVPAGAVRPPSVQGSGDARLDEPVMRSMDPEPDGRYQRAEDLGQELETLGQDAPRPASPRPDQAPAQTADSEAQLLRRSLRRGGYAVAGIGLLCVLGPWSSTLIQAIPGFKFATGLIAGLGFLLSIVLPSTTAPHQAGRISAGLQLGTGALALIAGLTHLWGSTVGTGPAAMAACILAAVMTLLGLAGLVVRGSSEGDSLEQIARVAQRVLPEAIWPLAGIPLALLLGDVAQTWLRQADSSWEKLTFQLIGAQGLAAILGIEFAIRRLPLSASGRALVQIPLALLLAALLVLAAQNQVSTQPALALVMVHAVVQILRLVFARRAEVA